MSTPSLLIMLVWAAKCHDLLVHLIMLLLLNFRVHEVHFFLKVGIILYTHLYFMSHRSLSLWYIIFQPCVGSKSTDIYKGSEMGSEGT